MSLDFNLSKTALPRDDEGRVVWTEQTENIIWAFMAAEAGAVLTEDNIDEFYTRCVVFGRVTGSFNYPSFTKDELRSHIGLSTNVFPPKTRTQWMKKLSVIIDNAQYRDGMTEAHEASILKFRKDFEREAKREKRVAAAKK